MAKKLLIAVIGVLLLTIVIAVIWSAILVRKSSPKLSGKIELSGLENPVEVAIDIYGIPHIKAQSEKDLYYALGFMNARDRQWQLDLFKRLSQGRLAEILGPDLIPLDYKHRVLGFHRLSKKLYLNADENSKAICRAYVDGINEYIRKFPNNLPIQFRLLRYRPEMWSPENVYGVLMWQQWMVTFNWESELAMVTLLQILGEDQALDLIGMYKESGPTIISETEKQYAPSPSRIDNTVLPPEFDYARIKFKEDGQPQEVSDDATRAWLGSENEVYASNCWAVSGARSRSGKSILANDPHIPHTLPSIWYMVHLSAPGVDDAAGIMTPGVPMIVMGHTRHIAWGDTTTGADTQDLYIEKLNPDNPNEYLYDGEYRPFDTAKEIIRYREGRDIRTVEKEILFSVHGPIINDIADPPIHADTPLALRWAGYELSDSIKSSSMTLKATNWEEFRDALRHTVTPVWNWVYADAAGNIGYQVVGRIPIRKKGKGLVPVPGWLKEYEWDGYIPYDEMPRLFNPSNGYIVTANNRVTPEDYPYLISTRYAPPYRAARIEQLILAQDKLSTEDMRGIQMDVYSKRGERLRDRFVDACEKYPQSDPDFAQAVELLRDWDLNVAAESPGTSIFYESDAMIARKIINNRMKPGLWRRVYRSIGNLDNMVNNDSAQGWFDDPATEGIETVDETIAAGVADAVKSLREFFGQTPPHWEWGGLHTLTFTHPLARSGGPLARILNRGPYPMEGANSTVNPGNYYYDFDEKPYAVIAGPSMRTVIDFGDPDATKMVITLGQSENPFGAHYADQLPYWLKGESLPMYKKQEAIDAHLESRLILTPAEK